MTGGRDDHALSAPDGWTPLRDSKFSSLVGPIWVRETDEATRYAFVVADKHDNGFGRAHGGMVMTFCDEAMGMAVYRHRPALDHMTISLTCNFIGGPKTGQFVEIEPEIVRATASMTFVQGMATIDGEPVAQCAGVWRSRPRKTA